MADTKLQITVDNKPVTLFMSYGLLEAIMAQLETDQIQLEQAPMLTKFRVPYLKLILKGRPRYPDYGLVDGFDPDQNDISADDVDAVFAWASEHVTSFFVKKMAQAIKATQAIAATVPSAASSETGS